MARLIDERFRAIAARLNDLSRDPLLGYAQRDEGLRARISRSLARAGQMPTTSGSGPDGTVDVYAVSALVARGELTQSEADEYLAQDNPEQRWAGGVFGGLLDGMADADAIEAEMRRSMRGGRGALADVALASGLHGLKKNRGADGAASGDQPVHALRVPDSYDPAALQAVLDGLAEQVAQAARAIKVRPPELETHSVDGGVLRPGSVPLDALARTELEQEIGSWPTAEQSIEMEFTHSETMDRYVRKASTGVTGPGRVWVASEPEGDTEARIGGGPTRYRVVRPGSRFGVMSLRLPPNSDLSANLLPGFLVQYGAVLTGIPHWRSSPPSRLLGIEAVGEVPVSMRTLFATGSNASLWTSGGTTRDFFWNRTTSEHIAQGAYPFADAFGTDTTLSPSATALRDCLGFSFQLITGRDAGEVFRQLCSRTCLGRGLRMDAYGPAASIPPGQPIESPTLASAVDWLTPTEYVHRIETHDLSTARLVQGLPFTYDDCAAFVPTEKHFSIVALPLLEKLVAQAPAPTYGTPEVWHQNGLKAIETTAGRLRSWALDIIVD